MQNPESAIRHISFPNLTEQKQESIKQALLDFQKTSLDELKSQLSSSIDQLSLDIFALNSLKSIFTEFTEFHDKELCIESFVELAKKFRGLNDNQARETAEQAYYKCTDLMTTDSKNYKIKCVRRFNDLFNPKIDKYHFVHEKSFQSIVEQLLGYSEMKFKSIIFECIDPTREIGSFSFVDFSKESKLLVQAKVRMNQKWMIDDLQDKFNQNISKEELQRYLVDRIKMFFTNFNGFFDEKLSIEFFLQIINKSQDLEDVQARNKAQQCYNLCFNRALKDSTGLSIIRVIKGKKHCTFRDEYFEKIIELSGIDPKIAFGPDYLPNDLKRHLNDIAGGVGSFVNFLGASKDKIQNEICTIF